MIKPQIRRAAILTLALVVTYGLYRGVDAELATQAALRETAAAIEQQKPPSPRDVRIVVRDPDADPRAIRRALRRAGVDAIIVARPGPGRDDNERGDQAVGPRTPGPDREPPEDPDREPPEDPDREPPEGPDEQSPDDPDREPPDDGAGRPDDPAEDRPLLAVCVAADTDPLLVASLCAGVDVDKEPNR